VEKCLRCGRINEASRILCEECGYNLSKKYEYTCLYCKLPFLSATKRTTIMDGETARLVQLCLVCRERERRT